MKLLGIVKITDDDLCDVCVTEAVSAFCRPPFFQTAAILVRTISDGLCNFMGDVWKFCDSCSVANSPGKNMCRCAPPESQSAHSGSRCGPVAGRSGTIRWFSLTSPHPATVGRSC